MVTCPRCKNQLEDGATFCDNCGAQLAGAGAPLPPIARGGLTCPKCGQPVEDGATFCDSCGSPLTGASAPRPAPAAVSPLPPVARGGLTCPKCGQPVEAGATFCDSCGSPLASVPRPAPAAASPLPPAAKGGSKCPKCGKPAVADEAFCENCGAPLSSVRPQAGAPGEHAPTPTPQAATMIASRPPSAYAPPMGPAPRLVVQPTNVSLPFPPGKMEIIAGREDPGSNVFPEVNLAPYDPDKGGISRRHAKFSLRGNQWQIEDLNSKNFTFVNKQKVQPGQPRPLNNGDEIRLGQVTMRFFTS